ncbi:hypothetical protein KCU89_g103, partial [Aureobasidium melanogenum]
MKHFCRHTLLSNLARRLRLFKLRRLDSCISILTDLREHVSTRHYPQNCGKLWTTKAYIRYHVETLRLTGPRNYSTRIENYTFRDSIIFSLCEGWLLQDPCDMRITLTGLM